MGIVKQLINFATSGLDYDSDKRVFGPGDSDLRVNVTTDELGRQFVISNIKGTTEKAHSFSHDASYSGASYTVIGSVYDDNRDAVYIAIHSTLDNHCILRYNYSDDSFDKIAWDHTNLGFDIDYPLADMYLIENFLHWNPVTSSPRVINVQWAYWDFVASERSTGVDPTAWSIGTYVKDYNKVFRVLVSGYTRQDALHNAPDTDVEFIDWCYCDVDTRAAGTGEYVTYRPFYNTPITPFSEVPYVAPESDANYNANYIRGNIFQFCYRFYVPGMGYTTSSSFSEIVADFDGESFNGEDVGSINTNNKIVVGFNLYGGTFSRSIINENRLWEFTEILFRKNNDRQWRLADRIYHADGDALDSFSSGGTTNYIIKTDFYNDRMYEIVDTAAVEKQYNGLPIAARSQWALDGERTAYGGVTEGRNYIVPDVTLTNGNRPVELNYQSYPGSPSDTLTFTSTVIQGENGPLYTWKSAAITSLPSGGTSPWTLRFLMYGNSYSGSYAGAVVADYRQAVLDTVNLAPVSAFINGSNQIEFTVGYAPTTPIVNIYGSGSISSSFSVTKVKTFKTNANHAFCLFYYDDARRRSDSMAGSGTQIFVPSLPDEGVLTAGTNHQQYLDWEVNHNAPSWAKWWRWGYAGNQSVELFWQYNVESIVIGTGGLAQYAIVDISGLQTIADPDSGNDNVHVNSNIGTYVFEEGDKVRFITQHTGSATDTTDLTLADPGYDYEIKGFDPASNHIYIDSLAVDGTPYTDYNGGETIIEIYRPKRDPEDMEYYEIGPLYEVYESSGQYYHRGATQDQTSGQPAIGQHNSGDAYLITRQVANGPFSTATDPVFVESYSWSDFYDSDTWGQGKLGIISGIGQKYLNNVRYGNRYSPNTLSSGLSEFDALDYKSLSHEHGKITAMRQAGHVLKVYFERNSASIMVNKAQFLDADGVSQVVKSDDVLGTVEYSNYHYGTIFPESVLLIDRTIYFYDIYRKAYVRDSSNGVFAISEYKAVSKFVDISDALLSSGVSNIQVWTGYDPQRKFVYVQIKDSDTPANNQVIVFNEKKNRWECTVDIENADLLRSTSRDLISFIDEDMYIHNDSANRGRFYGVDHPMRLNIIMNESAAFNKILDSISLNTNNGDWVVTDIVLPPTPQYPNGQYSKIPNEVFTNRESGMHSEFLRNMKTSSAAESLLELREGEQLRGQTATITLENDATTEVLLFDVVINMSPSKI
jgi:hypothetical protein